MANSSPRLSLYFLEEKLHKVDANLLCHPLPGGHWRPLDGKYGHRCPRRQQQAALQKGIPIVFEDAKIALPGSLSSNPAIPMGLSSILVNASLGYGMYAAKLLEKYTCKWTALGNWQSEVNGLTWKSLSASCISRTLRMLSRFVSQYTMRESIVL